MVELQIINKILKDKSDSLLSLNEVNSDYFNQYKEEYNFIMEHKEHYGNIPDLETFLAKFPEFDVLQVMESDEYLINTFREEHLYELSVPVLTKISELLQTDSYAAVAYLKSKIPELQVPECTQLIDIISSASSRLDEYKEVRQDKDNFFIPSGFKELDEIITGWHRGEEFVVLFARTGQGKSWILIKILEHAWKMNMRVGLIEPEMSANKTGYRFDTLHKNISNSALNKGEEVQGYERYINSLQDSHIPFFVAHPRDFKRKVTVSKLRSFVENNKLDILAVDGISYLTDERKERGDSRTTQLTNISEDLMDLSIELGVPVIVVAQSNREGAKEEDLALENIRDSDGIAYNASIVISMKQKDNQAILGIVKNRNGRNNVKLSYLWDIDLGKFEYIPDEESGVDDEEQAEALRRRYRDKEEVF